MSGDQLLLLAQCTKEAEGMRPEADNRHDREQQERAKRARRYVRSLAPTRGGKYDEREYEPGRGLHADPDDEQGGCRPEVSGVHRNGDPPRARGGHGGFSSRERQRSGQDEQHERVVVRAADGKLQKHRIQADEHGRHLGRVSHLACSARRQGNRRKAARDSKQLKGPKAAAEPERSKRIGAEREQGPVGGMLKRPTNERKDGVGWSFRRDVGVGIQSVQHAQASKLEVAKDVLRDERWTEQQQQVGRQDRKYDRLARQDACGEQRGNVAGAHQKRQHLEAGGADATLESV